MSQKMSFNATWSMAVGGMIGGGIFSVLGVIVETAGQWAWLSFLMAGLISLISAHSYSQLSLKYREGGGAFTFLRKINHAGLAGSLSWVLILGYILTISVYAFTFGEYLAHVFDAGAWLPRVLSVSIIGILLAVNLRGVDDSSKLEIVTVYGKLMVLIGLAFLGFFHWDTQQLSPGTSIKPWSASIIGAATIFMAYEGFQLLSYDYKELKNPRKTLPGATMWAVVAVIFIYIAVSLGATMLVGAEALIEQKEVALSIAGKKALGFTGLILVTIAAVFSTGSAINATLFSTARLMESIAEKKDLPDLFVKENKHHVPFYSVAMTATFAAIFALIGNLGILVDSASLVFLLTFGTVNFIAFKQKVSGQLFCLTGAVLCAIATGLAIYNQWQHKPIVLLSLVLTVAVILVLRHFVLKKCIN